MSHSIGVGFAFLISYVLSKGFFWVVSKLLVVLAFYVIPAPPEVRFHFAYDVLVIRGMSISHDKK